MYNVYEVRNKQQKIERLRKRKVFKFGLGRVLNLVYFPKDFRDAFYVSYKMGI